MHFLEFNKEGWNCEGRKEGKIYGFPQKLAVDRLNQDICIVSTYGV
jgi:hypothetical protein